MGSRDYTCSSQQGRWGPCLFTRALLCGHFIDYMGTMPTLSIQSLCIKSLCCLKFSKTFSPSVLKMEETLSKYRATVLVWWMARWRAVGEYGRNNGIAHLKEPFRAAGAMWYTGCIGFLLLLWPITTRLVACNSTDLISCSHVAQRSIQVSLDQDQDTGRAVFLTRGSMENPLLCFFLLLPWSSTPAISHLLSFPLSPCCSLTTAERDSTFQDSCNDVKSAWIISLSQWLLQSLYFYLREKILGSWKLGHGHIWGVNVLTASLIMHFLFPNSFPFAQSWGFKSSSNSIWLITFVDFSFVYLPVNLVIHLCIIFYMKEIFI